jgi:hypothetical protein
MDGGNAVKTETAAERYRKEAAECELNAEKTTSAEDREAWQRLAGDWMRLALESERAARGRLVRLGLISPGAALPSET